MLRELPKEPEWARGPAETEANPATAFYGEKQNWLIVQRSFLVSFRH